MRRTIIRFDDIRDKTYPELIDGVCSGCGRMVTEGEYPFCPHGTRFGATIKDEIPGGITLENYGPHSVTFYSHSERRAYMRAHGLAERETFAPLPGTDRDPQGIPNPNGYRDLSAAAIIARNGRCVTDDPSRVGGPEFDPTDRFDIPNDPSLAKSIPGAFNETVEGLTSELRTLLQEFS